MAQILTLLVMAVQLLTAVQSNPNLPQSFRDNAIQIANTAISVAQEAIVQQKTDVVVAPEPTTKLTEPVTNLGSVTPTPEPAPAPIINKSLVVSFQGKPWGGEIVGQYLENGQNKSGVEITLTASVPGDFNTIIQTATEGDKSVAGNTQISGVYKANGAGAYRYANFGFQFMPTERHLTPIEFAITANGITASTTGMY